jgi:aspartate/methionine/tyrosine aminotransferase
MEHEKRLKAGEKMPFKKVIYCNIGNPQSLEQKPITFHRQVLSLVDYPELLANKTALSAFPDDAVARAKAYLAGIPGGTGAYSESQGVAVVRQEVANFITERDGFAASPGDVFLTDGASPAVQMLIRSLIRHDKDTIMIPIPQVCL